VKKKVIYTVLLGDYKLREPIYINKGWKLLCFTDRPRVSKNWKILCVDCNSNLRQKAREIKIRCDKYVDFDICLFIDAKFTIKCDLDNFIKENLKTNMALMTHNKRSCIYDEAKFCIKIGVEKKNVIQNQINLYKEAGFPKNFGLYGTGIIIRKNVPEVIKFMKLWYNEVNKHSCRDQISFPYVLWNNPIKIDLMPFKETYAKFK